MPHRVRDTRLCVIAGQLHPLQCHLNRSLGGDAKMLEHVLGRCAGAEAVHAHAGEFAVLPDHRVPAQRTAVSIAMTGALPMLAALRAPASNYSLPKREKTRENTR
jgi:hypothetical protein